MSESENTVNVGGRVWRKRGDSMADCSAFTEALTLLKQDGLDLGKDVFATMGGLLDKAADGNMTQSVVALASIGPQFLSNKRLCALIRATCALERELDASLESRVANWKRKEGQEAVRQLLPLFLGTWSEVYFGSLSIGGDFQGMSEAILTGAMGGSPTSTPTNGSPQKSPDSAGAATPT